MNTHVYVAYMRAVLVTNANGSIRQHTHTSAYVSIRQFTYMRAVLVTNALEEAEERYHLQRLAYVCIRTRQHTHAHTSAYAYVRKPKSDITCSVLRNPISSSAYVSIRQHTSACVT